MSMDGTFRPCAARLEADRTRQETKRSRKAVSEVGTERRGEGEEKERGCERRTGCERRRGREGVRVVWDVVVVVVVAHRRSTCSSGNASSCAVSWSWTCQANHGAAMGDVQEGNARDGREMEVDLTQHPSGIQPQLQYVRNKRTKTNTRTIRRKRGVETRGGKRKKEDVESGEESTREKKPR